MWKNPPDLGECKCVTCAKDISCVRRRQAAIAGTSLEPEPPQRPSKKGMRNECRRRLEENIVERNKKAVMKYSQQQRDLRQIYSRDSVRMYPWNPNSPFRLRWLPRKPAPPPPRTCGTEPEPAIPSLYPRKQSSLLGIMKQNKDCKCELMSRAIGVGVHRHLGLMSRRNDINAGLTISRHSSAEYQVAPMTVVPKNRQH